MPSGVRVRNSGMLTSTSTVCAVHGFVDVAGRFLPGRAVSLFILSVVSKSMAGPVSARLPRHLSGHSPVVPSG